MKAQFKLSRYFWSDKVEDSIYNIESRLHIEDVEAYLQEYDLNILSDDSGEYYLMYFNDPDKQIEFMLTYGEYIVNE